MLRPVNNDSRSFLFTNDRRLILIAVSLTLLGQWMISSPAVAQDIPVVNGKRLNSTLQQLASFGKDSSGGTSRVAYTDADLQGRDFAMGLMRAAGLEVTIDFAGNIIGTRAGTDPSKKPIAFGSHIDTVPNGGDYDGCVGSMSAIEVVKTMADLGIQTRHPLEVIIFANEEGGVVGSRAMTGVLKDRGLELVNRSALTVREGTKKIGGDAERIKEAVRGEGDMAVYLELHIEQGALLDAAGLEIGVVEGIVGIEVWEVTVEGFANHAGTTPMNLRKDALLAASRLITVINEVVTSEEGAQVGTVGIINAEPGAPNVIPGKVTFTLEMRDLSTDKIWRLFREIEQRAAQIAEDSGTDISFSLMDITGTPALADKRIQQAIIESTEELELSYQVMPSGAGHDAQEIAQITSMGMIFVPSVGGISHSPKEYSRPEDITNGANVLLNTLLKLDKRL